MPPATPTVLLLAQVWGQPDHQIDNLRDGFCVIVKNRDPANALDSVQFDLDNDPAFPFPEIVVNLNALPALQSRRYALPATGGFNWLWVRVTATSAAGLAGANAVLMMRDS